MRFRGEAKEPPRLEISYITNAFRGSLRLVM